MAKMGHTFKAFIIIIKTPSYLLKINKRTKKKYLCDSNFVMHLYKSEIYFLASRYFFDILLVFFLFFKHAMISVFSIHSFYIFFFFG